MDDIPHGRFTILSAGKTFLVEKNGEGTLNPLAGIIERLDAFFAFYVFVARATFFEENKILLFA